MDAAGLHWDWTAQREIILQLHAGLLNGWRGAGSRCLTCMGNLTSAPGRSWEVIKPPAQLHPPFLSRGLSLACDRLLCRGRWGLCLEVPQV